MDQDTFSTPISSETQLKRAAEQLIESFDLEVEVSIEVATGFKRKAGQYSHSDRKIRVSKHLLENHPEKVIETLKHELAHAVVMEKYGKTRLKPHGEEWKAVMNKLGVSKPEACHNIQLTDYAYIVRCTNPECGVELGRYRESRLVKKPEQYICKECGSRFESCSK